MRNLLAKVGKGQTDMVAAAVRTIFAQPTAVLVREQVDVVAGMLEARFPAVAALLREAKADLTAFADFPGHWRKVWSNNPIERLNREIKRRTDVVGISPTSRRWTGSSAPPSSRPTTSGRSPTAATCPRPRWPYSPRPSPPP